MRRERVKAFLEEYETLCRRHGMMIDSAQPFTAVEVVEASEEEVKNMVDFLAERAGLKETPHPPVDSARKWLKGREGGAGVHDAVNFPTAHNSKSEKWKNEGGEAG